MSQLSEVKAQLASAEREREENRHIMRGIQTTLGEVQVAISRLTTLQEETARRISSIDKTIGDNDGGMMRHLAKVEGIQLLDQSEVSALGVRITTLENDVKQLKMDKAAMTRWALSSMAAAVGSLLLVIGRILHIIP